MKRVLITGMSGTGKSTVISELRALGYKAIDTDYDGWCGPADGSAASGSKQPEWIWREDRIQGLLSMEDASILFLSGCVENQGKFLPQFDHVILLSISDDLAIERLATRATNPYGKHPDELARELSLRQTVGPMLQRGASLEVDTGAPLDEVIQAILEHVGAR